MGVIAVVIVAVARVIATVLASRNSVRTSQRTKRVVTDILNVRIASRANSPLMAAATKPVAPNSSSDSNNRSVNAHRPLLLRRRKAPLRPQPRLLAMLNARANVVTGASAVNVADAVVVAVVVAAVVAVATKAV